MGSLLDYLKKHVSNSTRSLFSLWIIQIIHGMAYMERKRFVHRDLAARNILMQSHSRVGIFLDYGSMKRKILDVFLLLDQNIRFWAIA